MTKIPYNHSLKNVINDSINFTHTHSHTVCLANKALSSFLYQIIIIFHNQPRVISHMFRHYVAEPAAAGYKLQANIIKKEEKKSSEIFHICICLTRLRLLYYLWFQISFHLLIYQIFDSVRTCGKMGAF